MRQIVYISSSAPRGAVADVAAILRTSQANNARDGVTGLLYTDGVRFLQALEGEPAAVQTVFDRIRRDPRHHALVVLDDRVVKRREFGAWSMAHRTAADTGDAFDARIAAALAGASSSVRGTFLGLVSARRAA